MTQLGWLTLGAFAIGTEGFMIAGLLPAIARDLNVGLAAAGFLVTAFSLAYAVGAPVIAVLSTGLERRRLLSIGMTGFCIANLVAALAPDYYGLLTARLLLALSAASKYRKWARHSGVSLDRFEERAAPQEIVVLFSNLSCLTKAESPAYLCCRSPDLSSGLDDEGLNVIQPSAIRMDALQHRARQMDNARKLRDKVAEREQ
jgi:hypothetical protein